MNEVLGKRLLGACVLVAATLVLANLLPAPQRLPPPEAAAKHITYDLRQPKVEIPPEQVQATLQAIDPRRVVAQLAPPAPVAATVDVPLDDPHLARERAVAPPQVAAAPVVPHPAPLPKARTAASPKARPKTAEAATPPPAVTTGDSPVQAKPEPIPTADSSTPAPEAAKERSSPAADAQAAVTTSAAAPAQIWYVQVGAFAKQANAEHSVQKLKKVGIAAKLDTVAFKAGPRYRVRCGPFASSGEAQSLRSRVAKAGFSDARVAAEPR